MMIADVERHKQGVAPGRLLGKGVHELTKFTLK